MAGLTSVCIDGDFFGVDSDGKLLLKIQGDPGPTTWPYPCDVDALNSLHFDTDLGLWVPPFPTSSVGTASISAPGGDLPFDFNVGGDQYSLELDFPVIDPSTCFKANALLIFETDFRVKVSDSSAGRLGLDVYFDNGDGSGFGGSDRRWSYENATTDQPTLEDTQTVTRDIAGFSGTRNCKLKAVWNLDVPGGPVPSAVLYKFQIAVTSLVVNNTTPI